MYVCPVVLYIDEARWLKTQGTEDMPQSGVIL